MRIFDFVTLSIVLSVALGLYLIDRRIGMRFYEPIQLFLSGWIICLSLLLFNFVTYQEVFSSLSFGLALAFIIFFWFGCLFAYTKSKKMAMGVVDFKLVKLSGLGFLLLALLFGMFVLLTAQEVLQRVGSIQTVGLSGLRTAHWEEFASTSGVDFISSLLKSLTVLLALYLPIGIFRREYSRIFICSVAFAYLFLQTLAVGGRAVITYLAFMYLLVFVINLLFSSESRNNTHQLRKLVKMSLIGLFGVLVLYLLFGYFPSARNENLAGRYDQYLAYQQHAWLSDWLIRYFGNNNSVLSFAYGMTYFTSSLPGLTTLIGDKSISEGYYMGFQSFDILRKIQQIFLGQNSGLEAAKDIALVLQGNGLFAINPWATFLRDLVMDFGILGSLVASFLIGWASTRYCVPNLGSRNFFRNAIAIFIMLSAFIMALRGPFNLTVVSNTLVLVCGFLVLQKIFRK